MGYIISGLLDIERSFDQILPRHMRGVATILRNDHLTSRGGMELIIGVHDPDQEVDGYFDAMKRTSEPLMRVLEITEVSLYEDYEAVRSYHIKHWLRHDRDGYYSRYGYHDRYGSGFSRKLAYY